MDGAPYNHENRALLLMDGSPYSHARRVLYGGRGENRTLMSYPTRF
ncbi:MAG: hypothetical protein UT32_C0018G0010 [Parcubacteria group bacterium GW2011_GWC2_39_14]|nr:MAG: hypothetical protein UT32_C0018G0010 [Parcubacteria group bacterium GW2011_GWC2_39_14]KKR54717.1 MAG: hypothetical protein UT91_C0010G0010 [Parcubacteria group bacterium GW2011_GWA2_40_23]